VRYDADDIKTMLLCAVLGIIMEKVAYKPIRNSSRIAALITAISVSLFLEYGTMYFVKAETRTFPNVLSDKRISFLNNNVILSIRDIYIVVITVLLMVIVPGLKAFVAAVIGGIGIIPGAMFGGFFLGITETMVSAYGGSLYKDAVAFAVLILILLIKPNGLLGKTQKEKV